MSDILVIEPYFGGSHKQFLLGLQEHIPARYTFLTLPPRKWKMRMQLSAPWFAGRIDQMEKKSFHTVLCSTFVDVATLRALLSTMAGWDASCRFCTYFHENQFVYPMRCEEKSRYQFSAINFTTALASDRIAFNSYYNKNTFFEESSRFLSKASDCNLRHTVSQLEAKSTVLYPGIHFEHLGTHAEANPTVPTICWNHRWEHDKDPSSFFAALDELEKDGYDFRLVVLGQSFERSPDIFSWAEKRFEEKILHFGYVPSQQEYMALLQRCHIVVSTAVHEFFGVAVMEAVRAGCYPLLPRRLSYPELFNEQHLYNQGELTKKLAGLIEEFAAKGLPPCDTDAKRFSWEKRKPAYAKWLFG